MCLAANASSEQNQPWSSLSWFNQLTIFDRDGLVNVDHGLTVARFLVEDVHVCL